MIPNIHIYEQLMLERCQERKREMAELRLASRLRRKRSRLSRRLAATIGVFLIKTGSSLKQLEVREKQVMYEQ